MVWLAFRLAFNEFKTFLFHNLVGCREGLVFPFICGLVLLGVVFVAGTYAAGLFGYKVGGIVMKVVARFSLFPPCFSIVYVGSVDERMCLQGTP